MASDAWMYFAVPAVGVRARRPRSWRVHERGHPDSAAASRSSQSIRLPPAVPAEPRAICFFRLTATRATTASATWAFTSAIRETRHGERAVSAGISGLDCDRVWTGRRHGNAAESLHGGPFSALLAVYFARAVSSVRCPAAAAAGLLGVHVIQTWYARYPNSEIVTQALLFAALLAHAYAHEDRDRFFGPIAASLLGLALFTRLPVVSQSAPRWPRRCSRM